MQSKGLEDKTNSKVNLLDTSDTLVSERMRKAITVTYCTYMHDEVTIQCFISLPLNDSVLEISLQGHGV